MTNLLNPVPVQRARLLLAQGDLAAAARWAQERGLRTDDEPVHHKEREHLVLARVLLAQDQPAEALALLDRLHQAAATQDTGPESLDDNRLTRFHPVELIEMGVAAPAVRTPGGTPGVYSNTNYLLLCQLLEHVTGARRKSASPRTSLSALDSGTPSFRPDRMSTGRTRRSTKRGSA